MPGLRDLEAVRVWWVPKRPRSWLELGDEETWISNLSYDWGQNRAIKSFEFSEFGDRKLNAKMDPTDRPKTPEYESKLEIREPKTEESVLERRNSTNID